MTTAHLLPPGLGLGGCRRCGSAPSRRRCAQPRAQRGAVSRGPQPVGDQGGCLEEEPSEVIVGVTGCHRGCDGKRGMQGPAQLGAGRQAERQGLRWGRGQPASAGPVPRGASGPQEEAQPGLPKAEQVWGARGSCREPRLLSRLICLLACTPPGPSAGSDSPSSGRRGSSGAAGEAAALPPPLSSWRPTHRQRRYLSLNACAPGSGVGGRPGSQGLLGPRVSARVTRATGRSLCPLPSPPLGSRGCSSAPAPPGGGLAQS